jgi:ATP/maltotriose-dependent transcriptional regulator MalT
VAPFKVQFTVPEVAYVERLVGREEEHDFIHKELQYDGSRKTVVVHGLGGMGKTQLVLDYARRHRDEYSAVFWVNCKSEDTLRQSYAAAVDRVHWEHPSLERLKTMVESGNLDKMGDALKRWLDITKNDRWLLIFDNHDTPKLPGHEEAGAFDIRSFLPRAYHGAVLITTRSSQLDIGRRVAVKKLQDIEHSLEIMSQTSRRNGLHSGK